MRIVQCCLVAAGLMIGSADAQGGVSGASVRPLRRSDASCGGVRHPFQCAHEASMRRPWGARLSI